MHTCVVANLQHAFSQDQSQCKTNSCQSLFYPLSRFQVECVGFSNYGGRMAMLCSTPREFVVARALYTLKMFTISFNLSTIDRICSWMSCSIYLRITDWSLSISQPYITSSSTQASLVSSWRKSRRSEMKTNFIKEHVITQVGKK